MATRAARPLTQSAGNDTAPAVSPDGRLVAFVSDRDGGSDLFVLDIASGDVSRVTRGLSVRGQASWSADGRRMLVSAMATGVSEVYSVGRDGSGVTRLTKGTEGLR